MALTITEYLLRDGVCCPFCEHKTAAFNDMRVAPVMAEDCVAEIPMVCMNPNCEEQWIDKFRLYGVDSDTEERLREMEENDNEQ